MSKPVAKPQIVTVHYLKDGKREHSLPIEVDSHGHAVRMRREARSLYGVNLLHVSIEPVRERAP